MSTTPSVPQPTFESLQELSRKAAPRVLVVDDKADIRDFIHEVLSATGWEVTLASSGEEAVCCFHCERMDLVIVDIFMPEKDGFDTIVELRRFFPEARIIAMTGHPANDRFDVLGLASQVGAQCTLRKPFTIEELLEAACRTLATEVQA